jgi:hypothetical protein
MSREIVKDLRIVSVRGGVEISVEKDRLREILPKLERGGFVDIDGEILNVKDIVGIFSPKVIEEPIRRKNGQWKDSKGNWHDKGTRVCPICGNILPEGMKCGNCWL